MEKLSNPYYDFYPAQPRILDSAWKGYIKMTKAESHYLTCQDPQCERFACVARRDYEDKFVALDYQADLFLRWNQKMNEVVRWAKLMGKRDHHKWVAYPYDSLERKLFLALCELDVVEDVVDKKKLRRK